MAEGRVAKQIGSRGFFAEVSVRRKEAPIAEVTVNSATVDEHSVRQGWDTAARFGALLGMEATSANGQCSIDEIRGMVCDTSPVLVAIAAMRAVWSATGFEPPASLIAQIEAFIPRASTLSLEEFGVQVRQRPITVESVPTAPL